MKSAGPAESTIRASHISASGGPAGMEVWRSPWSVGSAAPRACSVSGAGWAVSWEKKKKAYVPKPYQQMTYPGQRVQMDVKVGPRCCITDPELRLFQYTAINEFARLRFLAAYPEQSSYSSADFLKRLVRRYASRDIRIECVQIDNGFEFTNRFSNSKWDLQAFFEKTAAEPGIRHKLIRPYTPRHNGKVERSHREDQKRFDSCHSFFSLLDFDKQLTVHNRRSNNPPMKPLSWASPSDFIVQSV